MSNFEAFMLYALDKISTGISERDQREKNVQEHSSKNVILSFKRSKDSCNF